MAMVRVPAPEAWAIPAPEGKAAVEAEEYELYPWALSR
jgi:hypothetical protein